MKRRSLLCPIALLFGVGVARPAAAGPPWTRDEGSFYVGAGYAVLRADQVFAPDFSVVRIQPYTQHVVSLYGEVGILRRWITATVEAVVYRRNHLEAQGYTQGLGDLRLGVWTGLLQRPLHLAAGLLLGVPSGDPDPSRGLDAHADEGARLIARSLPTGSGEWNLEARLSLGHSFGGARHWPLLHYAIAEAGYLLHTYDVDCSRDKPRCTDAFTYKLQLGTRLPFRFVERFWLNLYFFGAESFADSTVAAENDTGLGPGVTYTALGGEVYGRIYRGLGAAFRVDGPLRGRSIADGAQYRVSLSYER